MHSKAGSKQASTKRQITQQKKIYELYQPLIDQAIYIDDQFILMNQLLSSSKLNTGLPLDSISILNRTEYVVNLCKGIFRDVSTLLTQICDFDLSMTAINNSRAAET